jgi:hypothetical protein
MASRNQPTKMAVDQSCNRFQISSIKYLGLPHQQLPYFISLLSVLLKHTIIIHQHCHLLSSIAQKTLSIPADSPSKAEFKRVGQARQRWCMKKWWSSSVSWTTSWLHPEWSWSKGACLSLLEEEQGELKEFLGIKSDTVDAGCTTGIEL